MAFLPFPFPITFHCSEISFPFLLPFSLLRTSNPRRMCMTYKWTANSLNICFASDKFSLWDSSSGFRLNSEVTRRIRLNDGDKSKCFPQFINLESYLNMQTFERFSNHLFPPFLFFFLIIFVLHSFFYISLLFSFILFFSLHTYTSYSSRGCGSQRLPLGVAFCLFEG